MVVSPRPFGSINQVAMRSGIFLGVWGIICILLVTFSLVHPWLMGVADIAVLLSPVLSWLLTKKYAKECFDRQGYFTVGTGFSFCSLTGTYAMLWVLIATAFVVNERGTGIFTTHLIALIESPYYRQILKGSAVVQQLDTATNGKGYETLIETVRSFSREDALTTILFINLFLNPIISLFVGLLCKKDYMHRM